MKRKRFYQSLAVTTLALGLAACANDSRRGATEPANQGQDGGPISETVAPPVTYDIEFTSNPDGSCPDLAVFHQKLSNLPPDAWIRRTTVGMNPNSKTDEGSAPRANFLTILALASLDVSESRPTTQTERGTTAEQVSCERVSLKGADGLAREFKITASTPTTLKLASIAQEDALYEDKLELEYNWIGPREVKIKSRYAAMDFCPHYRTVMVDKEEVLRWGPTSIVNEQPTEDVDSRFIETVTRAIDDLPRELRHLAEATEASGPEGRLAIPLDELKKLKAAAIRRDLQVCPYKPKPTSGEEPPPPDGDAPAAPATPDTGVETGERGRGSSESSTSSGSSSENSPEVDIPNT